MGKIFCLIGKSCSGKDTLLKKLISDGKLELKPIILYTTRTIRYDEKNGREYYFIDEQKLRYYDDKGKIIEKRQYRTINGLWTYCTIDDGKINLKKNSYITIATLESYENLRIYFGVEYVIPIYIQVDDGIRLQRALSRERKQKTPNYDELCRRFLSDSMDFRSTKLLTLGIDKSFCNEDLDKCINNIKNEILNAKE